MITLFEFNVFPFSPVEFENKIAEMKNRRVLYYIQAGNSPERSEYFFRLECGSMLNYDDYSMGVIRVHYYDSLSYTANMYFREKIDGSETVSKDNHPTKIISKQCVPYKPRLCSKTKHYYTSFPINGLYSNIIGLTNEEIVDVIRRDIGIIQQTNEFRKTYIDFSLFDTLAPFCDFNRMLDIAKNQ